MSPDLVLFAVGGLLLITGLLGGGFEMRELKIPRVGRLARVLATAAGCLCLLLGVGLSSQTDTSAQGSASKNASPTVTTEPVRFTVRDELGEAQISEQVTLVVDGRRVGDLTVNADYPRSEVEISLAEGGRHDYTLAVSSLETDWDGTTVQRDASGQGSIVVEPGASYSVTFAESGDTRNVTLVAD